MMSFSFFAFLLAVLPLAHIGSPLAVPSPGTLFAPGAFRAVVRIPHVPDRLFVVGGWEMQSIRVVLQESGGRRTVLHGGQLPGAKFGVELSPDAWRARAVTIEGTSVNANAVPRLVAGTAFYTRAAESWPAIALFGMTMGLAVVACLFAITMRSTVTGWYSVLAAVNASFALPVLGAVRPPPLVNQPLHTLLVSLYIVASIAFARTYLREAFMPRRALWFAAAIGLTQIVFVGGSDLWQDAWPTIPVPYHMILDSSLDVVLLLLGLLALGGGRRDALWYNVAQVATIVSFFAATSNAKVPAYVIANAVSLLALTYGLALSLRAREDERTLLERAVRFDGLTGLLNRGAFDAVLLAEWSRGMRARTELAAIMIDVDNFKGYNDALGHVRGDAALRAVAAVLTDVLQRREDCIARYGGEEFIVLLPGTNVSTAGAVAEGLRSAVEALGLPNPAGTGVLTISLGVAVAIPEGGAAPADLVGLADAALYEAKRRGRNIVVTQEEVLPTGVDATAVGRLLSVPYSSTVTQD